MRLRCSSPALLVFCVARLLRCSSPASISCVSSRASLSALFVSSALLCAAHITPLRLHSFTPLNMLNPLTPLSVSFCSSYSYRPPKLFERFDPFQIFQAFDSYNYPDNSSVSIGSICLPPHALQRVKINFFMRRRKPERFEVFNSFEVFGVYGEYGEIKGVRRVRGFP